MNNDNITLFKYIRTTIVYGTTHTGRTSCCDLLSVLKFEDTQERMTIPYAFLVVLLNVAIVSSDEGELSGTSPSCFGESMVSVES